MPLVDFHIMWLQQGKGRGLRRHLSASQVLFHCTAAAAEAIWITRLVCDLLMGIMGQCHNTFCYVQLMVTS